MSTTVTAMMLVAFSYAPPAYNEVGQSFIGCGVNGSAGVVDLNAWEADYAHQYQRLGRMDPNSPYYEAVVRYLQNAKGWLPSSGAPLASAQLIPWEPMPFLRFLPDNGKYQCAWFPDFIEGARVCLDMAGVAP